ncbi:tetratricopeptide repeat protein [Rhodoferax sp.]|uniref:tetratricopeptide repeat protein n=1 Tax=Rhodoferax sp. TaxID=50421 RepID=UPI002ACE0F05|nr:tetratricopeptide repeat protein [Rhodoferax sp.]MDZ7919845.1 tetratricopeptide repeat protein [Rhodoferax sp.]
MTFSPLPPLPASAEALAQLKPADWHVVVQGEPTAAAQWMLIGARLGNADAQTTLGQWLLDGHGLDRHPADALAWFLKAAMQGHPMGKNMAGRCLENGWGCDADAAAAAHWYGQAAKQGLDAAMYNLANLLVSGKGVAQDRAAALDWYRQAASQGHVKSKTKMGRFYETGLVVAQDLDAAFVCFEEGARGGDFRGQFNYAGMLAQRGQLDDALEWLRKVPLTATPAYQAEVGPLLLQSPHAGFSAVGKQMLNNLQPVVAN